MFGPAICSLHLSCREVGGMKDDLKIFSAAPSSSSPDQQFAGVDWIQNLVGQPERASDRVDDPRPGAAIRELKAVAGQMENLDDLQIGRIEQPGGTGRNQLEATQSRSLQAVLRSDEIASSVCSSSMRTAEMVERTVSLISDLEEADQENAHPRTVQGRTAKPAASSRPLKSILKKSKGPKIKVFPSHLLHG
ncbi:hypothetical protein Nepgr_029674 [Nepenthes gracilis]|uniref:Uncharacterized protein n=1 Tax=Nepenthes gracilis TaxID=150966 RepID=A0AAD3TFC5_NEPGR|nr:hypothetical protein Nepgr_029674 [Nepenthes gracilis]